MLNVKDRLEVQKVLSQFGREVVFNARSNFLGKNASGKGARSLESDLEVFPNSFSLSFSMEDYMEYQDKGVSGKKKKYNTPFAYTNKRPPASAFDKWAIRRGLAGRNEKGQFLSRKSLTFALANHVYMNGIKPSLFFTKAFEKEFKNLPEELVNAYGLDVERFMELTLNTNR